MQNESSDEEIEVVVHPRYVDSTSREEAISEETLATNQTTKFTKKCIVILTACLCLFGAKLFLFNDQQSIDTNQNERELQGDANANANAGRLWNKYTGRLEQTATVSAGPIQDSLAGRMRDAEERERKRKQREEQDREMLRLGMWWGENEGSIKPNTNLADKECPLGKFYDVEIRGKMKKCLLTNIEKVAGVAMYNLAFVEDGTGNVKREQVTLQEWMKMTDGYFM